MQEDDKDDHPPSMMMSSTGGLNDQNNEEKVSHETKAIVMPVVAATVAIPLPTSLNITTSELHIVASDEPRQGQKSCGCCCDYH